MTAAVVGRKRRPARVVLQVFLMVMAFGWLFPVLWAVYNSLRDYDFTSTHGYFSFGGFTLKNYVNAWAQGNFGQTFYNSAIITIPSVVLTLLLASSAAFVLARFSFRFNLVMLVLFTAANLLPQQALLVPLFRMFLNVELPYSVSDSGSLYDTYVAVIAVNVAFQTGFCTFVLSNYMRTIPKELQEAAFVDGAGVFRQFWQVVLPLCRPALAALATLQITWVYNDFFWAVAFMRSGDKFPVTSSLQNLKGQFFTDYNLLSAGSVIVAIPTLVIFFVLQRHLRAGLTLGATKG
ncbi:carbohydrate ABC transporter permease [Actinophytocola sp.]|jgi:multiple sugar transport system permease protein|uniref:carbohydrate ABC transporter permease n=1 Tax=Actinophytocola sp. TaxID=1872138 RepID=UPI002D4DBACA|nr:carbohydrate ABC transporter permease [Actinophytocola sp.]HYQ65785.1 carbohydrate ABC transporter permease [Actinophytocola sp.]